jgi:hypothetical protein
MRITRKICSPKINSSIFFVFTLIGAFQIVAKQVSVQQNITQNRFAKNLKSTDLAEKQKIERTKFI